MSHRIALNKFTFAFLIFALLAGCAGTAPRAPQTIEEGLYVSAVYGKALTGSVNEAYLTGVLTKTQQLQALDVLDDARQGVQLGLDAFNLGDLANAQNRLDTVEALLRSASLILARAGEAN